MNIRNLKIGKRLTLGYIIILGFSIVTSVVSVLEINKIWSDAQNLYERPFMVSNLLRDIKINALNMRRYMLDMVLLNDQAKIEELEQLIKKEETLAYENYTIIGKLFPENKTEIETSFKLFQSWGPLRRDIILLVKERRVQQTSNLMIERNKIFVDSLFIQMQRLIEATSLRAEEVYQSALATKRGIVRLLVGILLVTLTISIIFAYYITRSIASPLSSIVQNIREIALGNLNNKKLPEEKDEIGLLSASYNQMQENLIEKAVVAEKIAGGDFSVRVFPGSDNDIVAHSINRIAGNFDLVVKQAQKVAAGNFEIEIAEIAPQNQLAIVLTQMIDSLKEVVTKARQIANGDYSGEIMPKSGSDELALALNQMTVALRTVTAQNAKQDRLKTAQNELNEKMRGDLRMEVLSKEIITFIAKYTRAQIGTIYISDDDRKGYQLMGSYAFQFRKGLNTFYKDGEGLIGQAAMEKEMITFSGLPDDYVKISSGIGDSVPRSLIISPFIYNNKTVGVIELGSIDGFNNEAYEFLQIVMENVAISVTSAMNRAHMARLLETTKEQAEELQVQQEELKQSNEELEAQTQALKKSEEYLQAQQEELRVTNEELEDKTRNLEKQKAQMEKQNQDLEAARADVENKARELEITNKYKSEFLANMSHELRTPLNSLLILSQTLMENKEANLTPQQMESAQIIYNSGNDLLKLINDILDLSRIESGKMKISISTVAISDLLNSIRNYFQHMISEKGLEFDIKVGKDVPAKIITDEQRLNQILRNLMSNAIKFTEKGNITLEISKPGTDVDLSRSSLNPAKTISISVKDTGIGIVKEKQLEIFEAFQQADGSISRRYGGTGLGLSITRELVKILGGEIKLYSEPGAGSEFIVYLPAEPKVFYPEHETKPAEIPVHEKQKILTKTDKKAIQSIPDDRQKIGRNDSTILIIEDDVKFAGLLAKTCRDKGFLCLCSATGEEGVQLAQEFLPKGIILDISLPGMNGWDVLESLKNSAETRHIPVHIISGLEKTMEAFNKGAIGFLTKPVTKQKLESVIDELQTFISRKIKDLLVIEDDENLRKSIKKVLGSSSDIQISECTTAHEAIELITSNHYDCIVLDLGLPDISGFEMLKILNQKNIKIPPVVVYTGKELSMEENIELQKYTQNIIIKGVKSEERLLDETALFLHRMVDEMPDRQKKMLVNLYDKEQMFRDKKILVVDDDMRNVFAITQVLEASNMKVIMAPNGAKALEALEKDPTVDLILMDIMMPVMDGYETMQKIRKNKLFQKVPIIALTAKAMKEDREKTIAAGANDYLSKPVDIQKLFNLMRIWLYQ